MTTFNDRENAFEKKFERDQDLQFKVNARRNKLLGLWAAGIMRFGCRSFRNPMPTAARPLRRFLPRAGLS